MLEAESNKHLLEKKVFNQLDSLSTTHLRPHHYPPATDLQPLAIQLQTLATQLDFLSATHGYHKR